MGEEHKLKLVTSWSNSVKSLPENYVNPPETRPGDDLVGATGTNIPVIDLGQLHRTEIIRQILEASQEFGFFQIINHGIADEFIEDVMKVFEEFHKLSDKEKIEECSKDPNGSCKMYTSSESYEVEKIHYWRDALRHSCYPVDKYSPFWPENPTRYVEVVGKYVEELRKLSTRILEMLSEGLGLRVDDLTGDVSEDPILRVNHYPPCPDPTLTLGLCKHVDPGLITILLQGHVCGLQVLKDQKWVSVDPIPNAFVVNIGYMLQVISNGKLVGVEHRAVTNSSLSRTTAAYLVYPTGNCVIQPAEALVGPNSPPVYKAFKYKDFSSIYMSGTEQANKAIKKFSVS